MDARPCRVGSSADWPARGRASGLNPPRLCARPSWRLKQLRWVPAELWWEEAAAAQPLSFADCGRCEREAKGGDAGLRAARGPGSGPARASWRRLIRLTPGDALVALPLASGEGRCPALPKRSLDADLTLQLGGRPAGPAAGRGRRAPEPRSVLAEMRNHVGPLRSHRLRPKRVSLICVCSGVAHRE